MTLSGLDTAFLPDQIVGGLQILGGESCFLSGFGHGLL